MSAEQIIAPNPAPYTDDIPVLTPQLLQAFRDSPRFAEDTKYRRLIEKIMLSPSSEVFKYTDEDLFEPDSDNEDVRIWRRAIPKKVQQFIACALDILGNAAADNLPSEIYRNEAGKLTSYKGKDIRRKNIAARYSAAGIDEKLSMAFADYFVRSFTTVLDYFPAGYSLKNVTWWPSNLEYPPTVYGTSIAHPDGYDQVIWNLSDPGTPYWLDTSGTEPDYRTQAGDLTIHGKWAWHGCATSALLPNGSMRPRFFMSYQIQPANNF